MIRELRSFSQDLGFPHAPSSVMNNGVDDDDDDIEEEEEEEDLRRAQFASVRWNASHVEALPAPPEEEDDDDDDARSIMRCVRDLVVFESSLSLATTAARRRIR
jgi:hypothetical protein